MGNTIKRFIQPPIYYKVKFIDLHTYEVNLFVNKVPKEYLFENLIKYLLNSSIKQKFYFKENNEILVFPQIDRIQFNKVILKLPFTFYKKTT